MAVAASRCSPRGVVTASWRDLLACPSDPTRDVALLAASGPCARRGDASRITPAVGRGGSSVAAASASCGHLSKHPVAAREPLLELMKAFRTGGASVYGSPTWTRLGDVMAKLVVLPFVGVSLCGAVTVLLGLQWVEMLQRRRPLARAYWGALLALLVLFLPSRRLVASVTPRTNDPLPPSRRQPDEMGEDRLMPDTTQLLNGDGKRSGRHAKDEDDDASYSSRPLKRQRSTTEGAGDASKGEEEARSDAQHAQDGDQNDEEEGTAGTQAKPEKAKQHKVRRRVFIWDLDETLVLFASLYTGTFAQTHGKEVAPGVALGEQMMTFLLAMLERHFFFSDLHDADVDHIARVATANGMGSGPNCQHGRQERYERIREIYERRGHVDFLHDAGSEWFAIRHALVAAIDSFSTGWLHEARQVLQLITESAHRRTWRPTTPTASNTEDTASSGSEEQTAASSTGESESDSAEIEGEEEVENVNVLVTNTQLVPALCKCLIYQLDAFFPIDRVYSSAKVHKYRCFETILAKYEAPGVEFIAIGDGLEEEQVSLALGLEFHKIRSLVDLKRLRYDLQLVHSSSSAMAPGPVDDASATAASLSVTSPVGQTAVV
ncbi:hypothetical protein BBJ28_00000616 [Nothophytophthora sp. Chile5]|nr:hypothetical protein BBJ28_00000616 [Nothophytophthora sp. Chile5]